MRIRRLRLEGFGVFREPFEVELPAGPGLVIGPNESGKSTLLEGMVAVLFGLRDRAAEERHRSRPASDAFRGEIEVETAGARYRLSRDFDSHRVEMERLEPGPASVIHQGEANPRGRTDDLLAWLSVLQQHLGLSDRELAWRTLFVRHGELETAVDEQIRHLLSGSSQGDAGQITQRLEELHFQITRENPWGRRRPRPRDIEELEEQLNGLDERRHRARAALEQSSQVAGQMESTRESLATCQAELERRNALLEHYGQFFDLNRERSELEKRLAVLREEKEKVRGVTADCERVEALLAARFASYGEAGPDFGETLRSLQTLTRDVAGLKDELRTREASLADNPWPRQIRRAFLFGAAAALISAAAMFGAGVGWLSLALGLLIGVLTVIGFYFLGRRRENERIQLQGQVVELEERLERQQAELDRAMAEARPVIQDRRLTEVAEEFRQYQEQIDLLSRCEQIRDSHRALRDVEADYDQVFSQLKLADSRARDLIARAPYLANADQNLAEVSGVVERLKTERDELSRRAGEAGRQLQDLQLRQARQEGAASEDLEMLEDEAAEGQERLEALRFRRDALRLAIETLRGCVTDYQEGHVERLAQRAAQLMERATAGRWSRLALDGEFRPLLNDAAGQCFAVDDLSQGARDQVYLSLRLAIIEEIFGDRELPVFLDDALVHCDETRREAVRRLLEEQGRTGRQILLLTHDASLARWGWPALELAAPARVLAAVPVSD